METEEDMSQLQHFENISMKRTARKRERDLTGACWDRGRYHRLQHLSGDNHGAATSPALVNDGSLQNWNILVHELDPEVPTGDHNAIGESNDLVKLLNGGWLLDLGHNEGLVAHQPLELHHVAANQETIFGSIRYQGMFLLSLLLWLWLWLWLWWSPSPCDCRGKVHKLGQSGTKRGDMPLHLQGACGENAGLNARINIIYARMNIIYARLSRKYTRMSRAPYMPIYARISPVYAIPHS